MESNKKRIARMIQVHTSDSKFITKPEMETMVRAAAAVQQAQRRSSLKSTTHTHTHTPFKK